MFVGRTGRICGALFQSIHHLRGSAGHGNGSVHHFLLAGLSELRLAAMGHCLPGSDLPGLGQSLHAHVRNPEHGGLWSKPQESRLQPELDPVSVLPQSGT